jgi:dTDP-glucose 4,6-dehydratase
VQGTFQLLDAAQRHVERLPSREWGDFRILHVSTDEVYGSLGPAGRSGRKSCWPFRPMTPRYLNAQELAELARWIDTLDRI